MQQIWTVYNKNADFRGFAKELDVDPVLVRLMRNRELKTVEQMRQYLNYSQFEEHDNSLLKDMDKAIRILKMVIEQNRRIRIIADYDVDGMTSNYILYCGLQKVKEVLHSQSEIDYIIPHRIRDGYGMNRRMIEDAKKDGVEVIVTCDNGIAAVEEIALAKSYGMTVVVTDHHELQEKLPNADAIVNPHQPDCAYPFAEICGAVVAYKVIQQLYQFCGISKSEEQAFYPYIALGTVCDVMPLVDENRFIVQRGIAYIKEKMVQGTMDTGLAALMKEKNVTVDSLNGSSFGFILGPCLNAVGRLSSAMWGMKLLLEQNSQKAAWRAKRLSQMNELRKRMSDVWETEAYRLADSAEYQKDYILVIYLPKCHESIAGIVAGRVREYSGKPTLIVTNSKTPGVVKGSARSIEEYDMFRHMCDCSELFTGFGGHKMAAGFSLYEEKIADLRTALNQQCQLQEQDICVKQHIDMIMPVSYISENLITQMKQLEPYGNQNEKPLFGEKSLMLLNVRVCGAQNNVLQFKFVTQDRKGIKGVYFGKNFKKLFQDINEKCGEEVFERMISGENMNMPVQVTYVPEINVFNGVHSVQLRVCGLKYRE